MSSNTSPETVYRNPLVSIVIPCFNQAHYLEEAIRSAIALTYSPTQIVVVDDGSTDTSGEVAKSCPEVVYLRQTNQGVAVARNTGLGASAGKFVIFLDHDDRLLPGAIEAGLNCFENFPESGFVFGRYRKINAAGDVISEPTNPPDETDFYLALLQRNPIGHPAIAMHRRKVLESMGGFDPAFGGSCDYHLYLQIARDFPVHKHDGIVSEYRWHNDNASLNYRYMLTNTLRALRTQSTRARRTSVHRSAMRQGLSNWRNHYGNLMMYDLRNYWRANDLDRGLLSRFRTLIYSYPPGIVYLTKDALRRMIRPA